MFSNVTDNVFVSLELCIPEREELQERIWAAKSGLSEVHLKSESEYLHFRHNNRPFIDQ